MKKQFLCIFIFIVLLNSFLCLGQNVPDSARIFKLETNDGNVFVGNIVAEDSVYFVIKTQYLGEIIIPQNYIKTKTELTKVVKVGKEFWLPNPQSARYFWAPNSYGLEKGSSYYQNIWILYNQFSYGVTNNFSIGAGTLPLFLLGGGATPIWVVPKFSIPVIENKLNLGTGAFLGTVIGEKTGIDGLLYGTTTYGPRDKNISFGFAYGFADNDWMKLPIINISALVRTGPKGYLITENYIIPINGGNVVLISLGGRSIIRNVGLDYSLWFPFAPEMDSFVAIPFLGITVPISRKK